MKIYHIPAAPPLYTNTFLLVGENGLAAAVDPAAGAQEYLRLLDAAKEKSTALWLVLQTLCGAGLRVSELRFVTVECMRTGRVQIACKGKRRVALLPKALCRKLQRYAQAKRRYSGPLFVTAGGAPLDRSHIWAAMKRLCSRARVAPEKVFPHNLRPLFART